MKKQIIIMLILVTSVILTAVIIAISIWDNPNNSKIGTEAKSQTEVDEVILDDCTDEYETINENIISTNANEEKISPNCKIVLTKYYKQCKDSINEYVPIPKELVNCTKKELQEKYKDWEIKEFSKDKVTLYKEFDEMCGEHYILRDKEGKIIIYKISKEGREELYEKTDIFTEYLPEKDMISVKNGLKINGREKLNQLIESFE